MKLLKSIIILVLFSSIITSCTSKDQTENSEINAIENLQKDNQNTQTDYQKMQTNEHSKEPDSTEKG